MIFFFFLFFEGKKKKNLPTIQVFQSQRQTIQSKWINLKKNLVTLLSIYLNSFLLTLLSKNNNQKEDEFLDKITKKIEKQLYFPKTKVIEKSMEKEKIIDLRKELITLEEENWFFEGNYYKNF